MSSNIRLNRICQYCGKEFVAKTTVTQYCGEVCGKRGYKAKKRAQKMVASNLETQQIKAQPIEEIKVKEFLTVRDVAKLLNSSRQTVHNLIDNGTIKAVKLSQRKTLVKRSEIDILFS